MNKSKSSEVGDEPPVKFAEPKSYVVGYCKPPVEHQFKLGHSANPRGRPKGSRNKPKAGAQRGQFGDIILKEAYRGVKINEGAKKVTIPLVQAVLRSLGINAVKGDVRSQRLMAEVVSEAERSKKRANEEGLKAMEAVAATKAECEIELERRRSQNITNLADILPHPDDVSLDFEQCTVQIHGPRNRHELAELDQWLTLQNDNTGRLVFLEKRLETLRRKVTDAACSSADAEAKRQNLRRPAIDADRRAPLNFNIQREIAHTRGMLEIIDMALSRRYSSGCIERRLAQLNVQPPNQYISRRATDEFILKNRPAGKIKISKYIRALCNRSLEHVLHTL